MTITDHVTDDQPAVDPDSPLGRALARIAEENRRVQTVNVGAEFSSAL